MANEPQHVDAATSKNNLIKTINSNVFSGFIQITNEVKAKRVNGALQLLQHLKPDGATVSG